MRNGFARRTGRLGSANQRAMQTEIRCSAGISVELLDWVVLVSAPCSSSPSKGTTSTLARVECRFDHTALAARPLHSAFGRTLAHTSRSWIDLERQQKVDLIQ